MNEDERRQRARENLVCPRDGVPWPYGGLCPSCLAMLSMERSISEEVFASLSRDMLQTKFQDEKIRYRSAAEAARGAYHAGLFTDEEPIGSGKGYHKHNRAKSLRSEFDLTGQQIESAHIVPQCAMEKLQELDSSFRYNPNTALATLLPKNIHRAFDFGYDEDGTLKGGWLEEWNKALIRNEDITVGRLRWMVDTAIGRIRELSTEQKNQMSLRLFEELYLDYKLKPDTLIHEGDVPVCPVCFTQVAARGQLCPACIENRKKEEAKGAR